VIDDHLFFVYRSLNHAARQFVQGLCRIKEEMDSRAAVLAARFDLQ